MCIRDVFWYLIDIYFHIFSHFTLCKIRGVYISTDTMRSIHSLSKRLFITQRFFQEGNLLFSHPLNCSLLKKRRVFALFYFSQRWMIILLWMMYNQFLWVMFPQKEWFGREQVPLRYSKLSLCPVGHFLILFVVFSHKELM